MKLDRKELLDTLKSLSGALAVNRGMPLAECFIFGEGNVCAFNDELALTIPLTSDLKGAVKAKPLLSVLGKLRVKEIEVTTTEMEMLIVAGKTNAGIRTEPADEELLTEFQGRKRWSALPKDFAEAMEFCAMGTSRDKAEPILNCVCVGDIKAESTDRCQICSWSWKGSSLADCFESPSLLSRELIEILASDVLGEDLQIAGTEGWIHFCDEEGRILSSRIIDADYPLLPDLRDPVGGFEFPEEFAQGLERAEIFTKGAAVVDEFVVIALESDKITVEGAGEDGWLTEELDLGIEFKDSEQTKICFEVNPTHLMRLLEKTREVELVENGLVFANGPWEVVLYTQEPEEE